jgi:hypothetical protein
LIELSPKDSKKSSGSQRHEAGDREQERFGNMTTKP